MRVSILYFRNFGKAGHWGSTLGYLGNFHDLQLVDGYIANHAAITNDQKHPSAKRGAIAQSSRLFWSGQF